jgi:lipoprotein LprG
MQTRRCLFAMLAVLGILTTLAAGCSSSKQSSKPLPDATDLVQQSSQATKNVKSVHLVLSVTGKIQGLPIKTMTGDLTIDPSTAAKGNTTITFAGSDIDAQFVVFDGVLYAALTPNKWDDFGPAADIYDVSTILNPNTGLANILANLTDAKTEGRENIDGQDTVRISGKVPVTAVNGIAPKLKATQPLPTTVWIQENGDHELVRVQLEQSAANSLQMTLSNWNQPVQVSKPPVSG